MKISYLRLANAIKAGTRTADFLASKDYDMELREGVIIKVTPKDAATRSQVVYTTLFNVVYWFPLEEAASDAPGVKGGKQAKGAPQAQPATVAAPPTGEVVL